MRRDLSLLALASFVLAALALYLSQQPGNLAHLWMADLCCSIYLLRYPQRQWWAILLCSGAAEWLARVCWPGPLGGTPLLALAPVLAHLLQSLMSRHLLLRQGQAGQFDAGPRHALRMLLPCVTLPPMVGALLIAASNALFYQAGFADQWLDHFLGSAIGTLSFLPPLLLLGQGSVRRNLQQIHWQRLLGVTILTLLSGLFAQASLPFPFAYSTAILILAALLLPLPETAIVVALFGLVTCIMLSSGGFIPPPMIRHWQIILVYSPLFITLLPPLLLAASITQTRQRERLLRATSDKMAAILRHAGDAIITCNESGVIESFNQAAEAIYRWPEPDALGKNLALLSPQAAAPELATHANGEREQVRHDGSRFMADILTSTIEVDGERKWITIVRDITERKRVEQLKSDFVSTVSHELRTPLTSIRGALGLLTGGVAGPLPEQAVKLLQISYSGAERLSILINDLLDMQKLEAGKVTFDFAPHAVATLLQDAVSANQQYARQYGVAICPPGVVPDCLLLVDANRMQQVLNNLLSNACKFSKSGGEVEIGLEIQQTQQGQRLQIAIIDHGSGIADDFKDKIFQKFSQSDASSTKAKGGTGLGLSIARTLVEQMHGHIAYRSQSGVGTTFLLDFPVYIDQSHNDAQQKHDNVLGMG